MDQVGSILDRPKLYYNIDGVGELGGGFTMLGFALLMWLQAHSPSGAIWHQMYAFVVYMAVMFSIIHYGTKAIKNHITYPRTGFVEYRKRDRVRPGIMAALLAPPAGTTGTSRQPPLSAACSSRQAMPGVSPGRFVGNGLSSAQ